MQDNENGRHVGDPSINSAPIYVPVFSENAIETIPSSQINLAAIQA